MRRVLALFSLVSLVIVGGVHPPEAEAATSWRAGRVEKRVASLGRGRTLRVWRSPNRRYALVYRDEGEVGDFVWRKVYLRRGRRYTHIDTYNDISAVRWSRDSRSVRYRARQAIGPEEMESIEVRVWPRTLRLQQRRLAVRPTTTR
jgi:hypothetical protein